MCPCAALPQRLVTVVLERCEDHGSMTIYCKEISDDALPVSISEVSMTECGIDVAVASA